MRSKKRFGLAISNENGAIEVKCGTGGLLRILFPQSLRQGLKCFDSYLLTGDITSLFWYYIMKRIKIARWQTFGLSAANGCSGSISNLSSWKVFYVKEYYPAKGLQVVFIRIIIKCNLWLM